jgi:hypothetical protein
MWPRQKLLNARSWAGMETDMNSNLKLAAAALGGIVATLAAGSIAMASMDKGLGPLHGADADGNGEITRAEWLKAAGASFDAIDANKDGKLVVGEIPPEHHRGPGRHGHHGPDGDDDRGPPPPDDEADAVPPAPVPAQANGN